MNVEKLMRVVEWLEAGAPVVGSIAGFNMSETIEIAEFSAAINNDGSRTHHACGTVCCIAGALVQFELQERTGSMAQRPWSVYDADFVVNESIIETGAALAEIDYTTASCLFIPSIDLTKATPAQGAQVLRHFIETGEVIWEQVFGED